MNKKGIVAIALLTVGAAFAADRSAGPPQNASSPFAFVYKQKCASCHGLDGRGRNRMYGVLNVREGVLDLTRPDIGCKKEAELFETIARGKGKMPGFDKKFAPDAIQGLVDYVKGFQQPCREARLDARAHDPRAAQP